MSGTDVVNVADKAAEGSAVVPADTAADEKKIDVTSTEPTKETDTAEPSADKQANNHKSAAATGLYCYIAPMLLFLLLIYFSDVYG